MKVTSIPLPIQDDLSYFYSLFQNLTEMNPNNKRRRKDGDESNNNNNEEEEIKKGKKSLKEILTSLLLLEEQERADKIEWAKASQIEKQICEANHKKKTQAMLDYYSHFQDSYSEMEESDAHSRTKRSRLSAAAAAAVAVASSNSKSDASIPSSATSHQRRLWVKDRSRAWWDQCNHPDFPESEFKRAFRMSRATFDSICDELNSVVAKEDTMLRPAIPVSQRVAVCIWRLATGEPLRLVSKRFGLGISTCHKLVLEVCSAIKTVLMPKYLQWPDDESLKKIKDDYESISGIPNVVGSMYTSHIPIIAPKISVAAYFNKRHTERNQKTSYSITVQGVVDQKGVFTDVCIGWPGSLSDDKVLEKSALYQRAIGGLLEGVWIVGSSGYPLMDWVLVPYTHQHLTWTQHAFNEKIGEIQRISKDAFSRLKGRWSCLQKRTEVKLQELPVILGACCVLHNICEMRNEEMDPELNFELNDDEVVPENCIRSMTSMVARDSIAHNLLHHGLAGTAFL
ncbi:hypothetical protein NE237_026399 [Protea cynaroides]|uniref:DDE Tnp4 domain-containing protein n=1 Tax=Protea cynaroides TaxID=273540 RepID=A0A9Q0H6M0_9MAGN|nr:hypothetical protein NE237_026399 [Protea cynaroides]